MIEMLTSILDSLLDSGVFLPALWVSFGACVVWLLMSAKRYEPLTLAEAGLLWKVHKQKMQCSAAKFLHIERKNKLVGFECECGYKHVQTRPIINIGGAN